MKRDVEFLAAVPGTRAVWRSAPLLAAGLAAIGIVALYWQTAASIVAIWWRSETYAHGFVVVPLCAWLAWRRRDELAAIPAQPWWPGFVAVFAAGALWFLASIANVLGVSQFALAFMVQAAIVAVLGKRLSYALAFPLVFLLFAVPAGEAFVPMLVDWTADFVVRALRWSGVPVYREANHFVIPSGSWAVVDACSGIRYLIASVMVGTIYAAVFYRSIRYRAAFLAASVLVPIVANWLRAYMIVMIGHLSANRYAVGVDHFIYGWLFFGIVMALLFWVGSFWRESPARDASAGPAPRIRAGTAGRDSTDRRLFIAALAAIGVAAVWLPLKALVQRPSEAELPALAAVAAEGGWLSSPLRVTSWRPAYDGYARDLRQGFAKDGHEVGLYIVYYRDQQQKGRELITSTNTLVKAEDSAWRQLAQGSANVDWMGRRTSVDRAQVSGEGVRLEVFGLYWIEGRVTSSRILAKLLLAWSVLRGDGDDAAAIFMYSRDDAGSGGAHEALQSFAAALSPAIERSLDAARRGGR